MAHDHGSFVWHELITHDLEASKAFYPEVFPWRVEPLPMAGMDYQMLKHGESGIGGLVPPPSEDVPTHWVSYLSVADVDATAKKVKAAGGKLLMDAFDVPGVARMQPVADPEGAPFFLFAADSDPSPTEGPGAWHWNELWAKDAKASLAFYEEVFGYSHTEMEMPNGTYYVLMQGEAMRGGILRAPSAEIPSMWLSYVTVDDVDATVGRATGKGAELAAPVTEVEGVGRFAILKDPAGAVLGVIVPSARD